MIYFAHPTSDYGSGLEATAIALICDDFQTNPAQIVNPNHPRHSHAYTIWGMGYFIGLAASCTGCVFMRMPSGGVGAGVAKEVESFIESDRHVWEITRDLKLLYHHNMPGPVLTVDETRAELRALKEAAVG